METVDNESATDIPLVKKCRAIARYLNAYFQIQPRERQHRFSDLDVHDPFERGDRPDSNPRTEVSIESIRGKTFNTDDGEGPYRVRDGDVGTDNCAFTPQVPRSVMCLESTLCTTIPSTMELLTKMNLARSGGIG